MNVYVYENTIKNSCIISENQHIKLNTELGHFLIAIYECMESLGTR